MFNMSDLSIELYLTEKSYIFLFKYTSLDSRTLNPLDTFLRVNIFIASIKIKDFFSIYKLITISFIMQTQTKVCFCFAKIDTKIFRC